MKTLGTRRAVKILKNKLPLDTVDNSCARKIEGYNPEETFYREISFAGIIILVFSICSYVFDFGSDIYLMITYYIHGDYIWFYLTLCFVVIPAIIMATFSILWYWQDNDVLYNNTGWIIRVIIHLLGMASLVRYIDTLLFAWRCKVSKNEKEKKLYYKLMIYEEADSAMLRMLECAMESSPQLLLQLYILFTQSKVNNIMVVIIQVVSSSISIISLSWCLSAYQSSLRMSTPNKLPLTCSNLIVMVIWKFLVILPRFFALALFTSRFGMFVLVFLGIHYLIMLIYAISQGTTFCTRQKYTLLEIVFDMTVAYVYCIDYLNIREGPTKWRYFVYYTISLTEIVAMLLLWYKYPVAINQNSTIISNTSIYNSTINIDKQSFYYQRNWTSSIKIYIIIAACFSFVIGMVIMLLYYLCCHPAKSKKKSDYLTDEFSPEHMSQGFQRNLVTGDNIIEISSSIDT